jgi:hypothetical protein
MSGTFIQRTNPDGTIEFVNADYEALKKEAESAPVTPHTITAEEKAGLYKMQRSNDYPAIQDQLDDLYHNGIEGWKATIKAVKDAHPKPQEQ